jgi:hypothetical protein
MSHSRLHARPCLPARLCLPAVGLWLAMAFTTPSALAQGAGLNPSAAALSSARWQARLERELQPAAALAARAGTPLWLLGQPAQNLRLLGDVQFTALRLGATGGLRLTGGLLLNQHMPASGRLGSDATAGAWSGSGYAGFGYASGSASGDWGFSADLGLTGLRFGEAGASALSQTQGLRDLRDARLQPVLRLGVNLSF